jgi:L-seryl-tRNA(Ser) seleniumtransferase
VLGGGTTPTETVPSIAIAISGNATALHAALLSRDVPIVTRIENELLLLDLRTILEGDDPLVRDALNSM